MGDIRVESVVPCSVKRSRNTRVETLHVSSKCRCWVELCENKVKVTRVEILRIQHGSEPCRFQHGSDTQDCTELAGVPLVENPVENQSAEFHGPPLFFPLAGMKPKPQPGTQGYQPIIGLVPSLEHYEVLPVKALS